MDYGARGLGGGIGASSGDTSFLRDVKSGYSR